MRHDVRGITLIELMAAFVVLTIALMGALALTAANVRGESIGVARLLATNLGREGIEMARAIRDSNKLMVGNIGNSSNWDTGLDLISGAYDESACAILSGVGVRGVTPTFEFVDSNCTPFDQQASLTTPYQVYRDSTTGVYYQSSSGARAGDTAVTNLYRRIKIEFICKEALVTDSRVETPNCNNALRVIGARVTVDVSSLVQGKPTVTTLVEKLYNWKL